MKDVTHNEAAEGGHPITHADPLVALKRPRQKKLRLQGARLVFETELLQCALHAKVAVPYPIGGRGSKIAAVFAASFYALACQISSSYRLKG